ncbi:hypothetical protein Fmac_005028 [Flemingia macrophylla]|uniref:Uncharacterized protein n=1 Tax=Flemingia macrophylla TaxID=520843 RepID=A0ABD1N7Y3_9FABA
MLEGRLVRLEEQVQILEELSRKTTIGMNSEDIFEMEVHEETDLKIEMDDNIVGQMEMSTLYSRLRDNPRKRVESLVTRTPWVTYSRRKKMKINVN